jgi:hypothetical protein
LTSSSELDAPRCNSPISETENGIDDSVLHLSREEKNVQSKSDVKGEFIKKKKETGKRKIKGEKSSGYMKNNCSFISQA